MRFGELLNLYRWFSLNPLSSAIAAADEVTEEQINTLEELVVTARRREENLTDVPLSIELFSSSRLKDAGITELETLATFTPNLDFQNVGNTQPGRWNSGIRFRGMEVDITTPTNQTGGFFVDGVPILGGASSVSLTDIASVEVIRGPQPVYFGRGTFGGAINYATVTPSSEFSGEVSASFSPTFGTNDFNAWIEGGSDVVSGRLTVFSRTVGSQFDSTDGGELGEENTTGVSGIIAINPIDTLRIKGRIAYSEDDDKSPSASMIPFSQIGGAGFSGKVPYSENFLTRNTDFFVDTDFGFGDSQAFIGQVDNAGAPDLSEYGLKSELMTLSVAVDYDLTDAITLSALVGMSEKEAGNLRDSDQYSAEGWITKSYLIHDTQSLEARISYDAGGPLRLIAGVSQVEIDQDGDVDGGYNFFPNFAFFPIVGYGISRREVTNIETTGIFAGVEYDISDSLTASLEARYQDEKNTSQQARHIGEAGASGQVTDLGSDSILPRISLNYQVFDKASAYLSYSEGELPGTVQSNQNLPAAFPDRLDEQSLETIEFGWKQTLADDRVFVSATLFSQKWSNMIANATFLDSENNPVQGLFPGSSTQDGLELSVNFKATDNLSGVISYGYTESEYDDYVRDGVDFKGRRLARSPKTSGALGLTWEDDFISDWTYSIRGDLIYRGDTFADEANQITIEGYSLLNLRATFENENLSFGIFCNNCADEEGWATGVQATDFVTFGQGVIVDPIAPRELGVTARYKF